MRERGAEEREKKIDKQALCSAVYLLPLAPLFHCGDTSITMSFINLQSPTFISVYTPEFRYPLEFKHQFRQSRVASLDSRHKQRCKVQYCLQPGALHPKQRVCYV